MKNFSQLFFKLVLLVLLGLIVSGCGGDNEPKLIGAYPSSSGDQDSAGRLPSNAVIVYEAQIDLRVTSAAKAVEKLKGYAGKFGGYVSYANIWYQDADEYATVVIAVPISSYDSLFNQIAWLGTVESETISGELVSYPEHLDPHLTMTTITVRLATNTRFVTYTYEQPYPQNTFSKAFAVTTVIFRFLLDALIWVVVVAGPFVLIVLGAKVLAAQLKGYLGKTK